MEENKGKIRVAKDTMLFVTNVVLKNDIKPTTTKDKILGLLPTIYEKASSEEIIMMLPYKSYIVLEKLMEYTKNNTDIEKFFHNVPYEAVKYLEESMIIEVRINKGRYQYLLTPGVIEKMKKIYTTENRKLAMRYGKIENLTKGLIYSYGVVEFEFFKKQICKYMKEIISVKEQEEIYLKRLNLNLEVNYYNVHWMNTNQNQQFLTYLDTEEDERIIGYIVDEQKCRGLNYKKFEEQEILSRTEYLWDKFSQKLFRYIKQRNTNVFEFQIQRKIKDNEFGKDILNELLELCEFENEEDIQEFINIFSNWYNNSPQYVLGGYSPNEMAKILRI